MRSGIRYMKFYALTLFSLLLLQNLVAQSFEETIDFADNQLRNGDRDLALKSYQRALFFSDGENNLYLFRQIADISFLNEDYETANNYYGLAYNQSDNDSSGTELLFMKSTCQILNRNYQFAIIDLLSINDTSVTVKNRLHFYLATCYFGLEDFDTAEHYFRSCVDENSFTALGELFTEKGLNSPSPKKARIMSMIIPGLGQTYSGDIKSGVNSLGLSAGLIALVIKVSIKFSFLDGVVMVLPWYQRYYMGGYNNAEAIAKMRRQDKRNNVYSKVLILVSENATEQK
jgi:tetratricopeptide (TPR) repeat protein